MEFRLIDRPPRNRRKLVELEYDDELEVGLLHTLFTTKAIVVGLARFHSSPAKGRLWKQGYKVHHRVLNDRNTVAAWLHGEAE